MAGNAVVDFGWRPRLSLKLAQFCVCPLVHLGKRTPESRFGSSFAPLTRA